MKKACALVAVVFALSLFAVRAGLQTDVQYGKVGGERLKLDARVPDGPGPFPAVILVHGGAWVRGDKAAGPSSDSMEPTSPAKSSPSLAEIMVWRDGTL